MPDPTPATIGDLHPYARAAAIWLAIVGGDCNAGALDDRFPGGVARLVKAGLVHELERGPESCVSSVRLTDAARVAVVAWIAGRG